MIRGRVKEWRDDEDWGVIVSDDVPGAVWAHAHLVNLGEPPKFHSLTPGQLVEFDYIQMSDPGGQDGFSFRATPIRRL